MSWTHWNRFAKVLAPAVIAVALVGCGGSEEPDAGSSGSGSGGDGAAATETAGPDEATKNAAIREVEQTLTKVRETATDLRKRAELDGVTGNATVQQALSALDRQISDAQSQVGALQSAAGEAWASAKSGAKSAVSAADQAANQLKARIDSARAAMRAEAIEAEKPMLEKDMVMGLNGEEYEAYKRSLVEDVQEQLSSLGLYAGPADGWLEASTKRALAALQEQHGLEQTGLPTPKTRRVLAGENPHDEE